MKMRYVRLCAVITAILFLSTFDGSSQNNTRELSLTLKGAEFYYFIGNYSYHFGKNIIFTYNNQRKIDGKYFGNNSYDILKEVIKKNDFDYCEFNNILIIGSPHEIQVASNLLKTNPINKLNFHKKLYLNYYKIEADDLISLMGEAISKPIILPGNRKIYIALEGVDWAVAFHSISAMLGYNYDFHNGSFSFNSASTPQPVYHIEYNVFDPADFVLTGIQYDEKKENRRIYYVFPKNQLSGETHEYWIMPSANEIYKEGDIIGDATLKTIEPDKVIFQRGSELIEVKI